MTVREVSQPLYSVLFEYFLKGSRRKPQCDSELSTRYENVAVDIPGDGSKNVLELQRMGGGEQRTRLLE